MKIFFRRIHFYLALLAGLVIMLDCLTGAVLVFEDEILQSVHHSRYYVHPGAERVPLKLITEKLKQNVPEAKIGNLRIYADAARTIEVGYKLKGKEKLKTKKQNGPENNFRAFANPYTGEIIDIIDVRSTFFFKAMSLHRWLLADDTGKLITGISTLIFLFIIITGIVLWWPANKNILKHRLKMKTDAGWKRTNHDIHIVLGFYASIILFVFAFTALAWSFKWFNNGIYYVTNSPLKNPEPPKSYMPQEKGVKKAGFDMIYAAVEPMKREVVYYNINAPKEDNGVYNVSVLSKTAIHKSATDIYYVDAYSGKICGSLMYKNKSKGAKIRATFMPLHTGSIWGIPSKIISCLVVLIGASLPVTGYIMWLNRIRKKRQKTTFV